MERLDSQCNDNGIQRHCQYYLPSTIGAKHMNMDGVGHTFDYSKYQSHMSHPSQGQNGAHMPSHLPCNENALATADFHSSHQSAAPDEPRAIVAKVSSGLVPGVLLPGVIYHERPGHPFPQRRYAALLHQPISEADCGGDVAEPNTGRVYGHIVQTARYAHVQVVYVVSVADALLDVNGCFDEEARLAAMLHSKQHPGLSMHARADPGENDTRTSTTAFEVASSSEHNDPELVRVHQKCVYFDDREHRFMPPASSASDTASVHFSTGSPSSASASTESITSASPPTQKRPLQVQFIHYKGSGAPHEVPGGSMDTLRTTEDDCTQFGAHMADGCDAGDGEIPISALLPDRKCPFQTCEYHSKGFIRKHDLVRHIITHYDGRLYCGFCPDGLAKSFGRPFLRVEPLKRHLAAVHDAAKFRKMQNTTEAYLKDRIREYGSVSTGHCSICSRPFATAAELYAHIEGCVVQLLLHRAREDNGTALLGEGAIMMPQPLGMNEAAWDAEPYMLTPSRTAMLPMGTHWIHGPFSNNYGH